MQATHFRLLREGFLAPCSSPAELDHLLINTTTQLAMSIRYMPMLHDYTPTH